MGTPLRLLIVEDSEDDADLLVRELRRGGYEPTWERVDTAEAMAVALDRQPWDVVVSDHGMPRFSAPAALALLRSRGLDVPFIIVSGSIGEEAAVEAMKSGAQDYILKGRLAKLTVAVTREVREAELRRNHALSEEELRATKERLDGAMQQLLQAEKMTALGELVAGVAHEVNNPLTAVLGYTQLALSGDIPAEVRRRLETVVSEAERASRIVRNLLTFARKHPPEKKYLGVNGIIEKTLELKAYHFRVNQVTLEQDLAQDLPKTMLDYHQIQQVLLNLFNNAEQAMTEHGGGGTLRLVSQKAQDKIEVCVTDTGPGIPADIQGRIFEPFFTTKKEGKGTGLGLSLCYGIVQEHGGVINVKSELGKGTTFAIALPILPDANVAAMVSSAASVPRRPVARLRIFVIDDEPTVQSLFVELLSSHGYAVDTASDVPQALRKIAANSYDLVITNMKLPHGTGKDIYLGVAEKDPQLAKRIIFTTGDGSSQETQRFVRQLGKEILHKPFDLEAIERVITAAVQS